MRFGCRVALLVFAFCICAGSSVRAAAQTATTGAIAGVILDSAGGAVSGAEITVTDQRNGAALTVYSSSAGSYRAVLLLPGSYRVAVRKDGFKIAVRDDVQVAVAEVTTLNIQLSVGVVTERVTVEGQPELAQTESSALGRVVGARAVENLPLVTRNYTQIIALSPGIMQSVTNAAELGRGIGGLASTNGGIFVHGLRSYDNNFQIDGTDVNDFNTSSSRSTAGLPIPNPDTIQEFKVQTGQYDASFGRNAGANVNLITKSGGDQFHGDVFEFFRNDALNANDFFFNQAGRPRPELRQNQFGGTLGGPSPLLKQKLFFFTSFQGTRQINGLGSGVAKCNDSVFSPPLTDDRSAAALGALFAGQSGVNGGVAVLADGSNINPIALKLLQLKLPDGSYLLPTPQKVDPSQPFDLQGFSVFSQPCTFDENQFTLNMDYLQSAKSKLSGRFFFANSTQNVTIPGSSFGEGNVPGFPRLTDNHFRTFSLSHFYIFSTSLINEARLGFNRAAAVNAQQSPFTFSQIGVTVPPTNDDLPNITIDGSYDFGGKFPITFGQNTLGFQDSVSYLRDRHSFRMGAGITRYQDNISNFRFNSWLFFLSFPDFLLGLSGPQNGSNFSNVFGSFYFAGLADRAERVWDGFSYFQDDFKVSRRLTVNVGVRYDRIGHLGDIHGRNSSFDPSKADPNPPPSGSTAGYVVSSNTPGAIPDGVIRVGNEFGNYGEGQNNLAPRFGFAWQLLPNSSRLVLRGGYGIYYARAVGQPFLQNQGTPPFANPSILFGTSGATFANPFPSGFPSLSDFPMYPAYSPDTELSLSAPAVNYRPPIAQQFGLNVQTALVPSLMLEVGYFGLRGTHQIRTRSVNQAILATVSNPIRGETTNTLSNISARVPIEGWAPDGIALIESEGNSWYNGLESTLTKRFSNGLQFLVSYTFSKSLDTDAANVVGTAANGSLTLGDQNDPAARYGPSSFDRTHRLVVSYIYDFPTLKSAKGAVRGLLNGWSLSGVTTIQSGQALTITATNPRNVYGISEDRAQLTGSCTRGGLVNGGSVQTKLRNYFNTSCFTTAPIVGDDGIATGFGNSGVGIARGPAQNNFDLALIKRTAISKHGENANIEFRSEFFNAFNTPQFSNPNTNFTSPTFGVISSASVNPRIIQFGLKLNF
ncbi:MAG TPA: carboxypeptidase regulatory-like domain-containing protein [Terriglobales bacterium]|nr:carboxypeptidase regulatory-like domain-containing protein [Terriglobales bacterium]